MFLFWYISKRKNLWVLKSKLWIFYFLNQFLLYFNVYWPPFKYCLRNYFFFGVNCLVKSNRVMHGNYKETPHSFCNLFFAFTSAFSRITLFKWKLQVRSILTVIITMDFNRLIEAVEFSPICLSETYRILVDWKKAGLIRIRLLQSNLFFCAWSIAEISKRSSIFVIPRFYPWYDFANLVYL